MKSSVLKRFFGIIISIILIVSSLSLISIYAVKDAFSEENVESSLDKLNFRDYMINYSAENYNEFITEAVSFGLSQEQVDKMLQSKACNKMLAQSISDVALGVFDGKNPLVTLSTCLTQAAKDNSVALMNTIDFEAIESETLTPEMEAKMTEEQKAEYEQKKQQAIDDAKDDFTTSLCDLVEQMRAEALKSNALQGLQDFNFSLIKDFILYLQITVCVCIILLLIMFIKNVSSALWIGINSFIIALLSLVSFVVTNFLCDSLAAVLVDGINHSTTMSTNVLAQIISSISSSILYVLSSTYLKYSGILSIVFIVLMATHILLKPLRQKAAGNHNDNDNFFEEK